MPPNPGLVRAKQTERLIAALRPASRDGAAAAGPSVVAQLAPLPEAPRRSALAYGSARLDVSGRLRDAHLFGRLGWEAGQPVEYEYGPHRIIVHAVEGSRTRLDGRGRFQVPETVRQRLNLRNDDGVPLAADVVGRRLIVLAPVALDEVVSA